MVAKVYKSPLLFVYFDLLAKLHLPGVQVIIYFSRGFKRRRCRQQDGIRNESGRPGQLVVVGAANNSDLCKYSYGS